MEFGILDAKDGDQSAAAAVSIGGEEVWDTVKFSFEIEDVSAFVYHMETGKVCDREKNVSMYGVRSSVDL